MSLRFSTWGNQRPWQFVRRPLDASLRRQMHGRILPMEEPSWLARLFDNMAGLFAKLFRGWR
jgi:hypothetical protein